MTYFLEKMEKQSSHGKKKLWSLSQASRKRNGQNIPITNDSYISHTSANQTTTIWNEINTNFQQQIYVGEIFAQILSMTVLKSKHFICSTPMTKHEKTSFFGSEIEI